MKNNIDATILEVLSNADAYAEAEEMFNERKIQRLYGSADAAYNMVNANPTDAHYKTPEAYRAYEANRYIQVILLPKLQRNLKGYYDIDLSIEGCNTLVGRMIGERALA